MINVSTLYNANLCCYHYPAGGPLTFSTVALQSTTATANLLVEYVCTDMTNGSSGAGIIAAENNSLTLIAVHSERLVNTNVLNGGHKRGTLAENFAAYL